MCACARVRTCVPRVRERSLERMHKTVALERVHKDSSPQACIHIATEEHVCIPMGGGVEQQQAPARASTF